MSSVHSLAVAKRRAVAATPLKFGERQTMNLILFTDTKAPRTAAFALLDLLRILLRIPMLPLSTYCHCKAHTQTQEPRQQLHAPANQRLAGPLPSYATGQKI